jgi:hypothetical protein
MKHPVPGACSANPSSINFGSVATSGSATQSEVLIKSGGSDRATLKPAFAQGAEHKALIGFVS